MPLSEEEEKRMAHFILSTSKMKMIIKNNRNIEDRELSRQLGMSFEQLQGFKLFCRINKMRVNEPPSNPVKKDFRKAV